MARTVLLRLGAALALAAIFGAGGALAQGGQPAAAGAETFTLEPGASATIAFEGFCYQYGEPFPDALGGPGGLAEGNIRSALALARDQGLIGSDEDALEVQYAIWQLQGQDDAPAGGDLATRILNQTRAAAGPTAPQGATSLIDAVSSGQVTARVTEFGPVGQPVEIAPGVSDTFYGRGRLEVTSASQEALTLYMPVGTIITAVDPGDQDLVAYATEIEDGDAPVASEEGGPPTQATEAPAQPTQVAQAPTQAPTEAATQAPTEAATQAPTQAPAQTTQPTQAAPTQVAPPTQAPQSSPVAAQPQGQQARSFLEPVNPAASASAGQLPNTSGGGLPLLALLLGTLALGAHGLRRRVRRRGQ